VGSRALHLLWGEKTMKLIEIEQWNEVTYDKEAGHGCGPDSFPIYHLGVGYYRRPGPEFAGGVKCQKCGKILHNHGWIDSGRNGYDVCPGDFIVTLLSGEHLPLEIYALRRSAQAWCEETTSKIQMDVDLASVFAQILANDLLSMAIISAGRERRVKNDG
jgi:hypothetical protein